MIILIVFLFNLNIFWQETPDESQSFRIKITKNTCQHCRLLDNITIKAIFKATSAGLCIIEFIITLCMLNSPLFYFICVSTLLTETRLRLVNDWLFSISNLDSHIVICESGSRRWGCTCGVSSVCIGNESVASGGRLCDCEHWQLADADTDNCSGVKKEITAPHYTESESLTGHWEE